MATMFVKSKSVEWYSMKLEFTDNAESAGISNSGWPLHV